MNAINTMKLEIESRSVNEGFSRVAVAAFVSQLDPTIEELGDIKTAVSEAVTNSIVHGYKESKGKIYITASIFENGKVQIKIRDKGCGIENISQAMEPLFTTSGGERAGLGFAVMENTYLLVQNVESISILWAIMRGFGTGIMHGMGTFLVGTGFSFTNKNKKIFIVSTFALLSLAITYHSVFNMLVQSDLKYLGVSLPFITYVPFVFWVYKKREKRSEEK